jgi:hypothetical protein
MMIAGKKRQKRRRFKTGPPDWQWNFSSCPHPEQTKACYLYEYSVESEFVRTEVAAERQRWVSQNSPSVQQKINDWCQANPRPPGGSLASLPTQEEREWLRKVHEAIPELATTKLHKDLHFLFECQHFPSKHWLEIPATERELIAKRFYPTDYTTVSCTDPARYEATPMKIETLEDFLARSWSLGVSISKDTHVFSFFWERSDRKLTEDFQKWLNENRPKEEPGFHLSKQTTSRATSPKDWLTRLAALRLIRHFSGNVRAARDYSYSVLEHFLYKEDTAWKRAEAKARQQITRFGKLVG